MFDYVVTATFADGETVEMNFWGDCLRDVEKEFDAMAKDNDLDVTKRTIRKVDHSSPMTMADFDRMIP